MADHADRLSNLEAALQGLKLVTNGMPDLQAKYPPLPKDADKLSVHERLTALEKSHDNFKMSGGPNTQVSGSIKTGFCVNNGCPENQGQVGSINIPPVVSCCDRDITEISFIILSGNFSGFSDEPCTDHADNNSFWTRINHADSYDGSAQFKMWIDSDCNSHLEFNGGDLFGGLPHLQWFGAGSSNGTVTVTLFSFIGGILHLEYLVAAADVCTVGSCSGSFDDSRSYTTCDCTTLLGDYDSSGHHCQAGDDSWETDVSGLVQIAS